MEVSSGSSRTMGVGGPQTISNDGILYRPLAGHDFHDIFDGSMPPTELDAPADIFDPSQRVSLGVRVQGISYSTATLFETKREPEIVAFDYSNGNILYNPLADHDSLSDMPTRSFEYFEPCPPLTPASAPYSHPTGDFGYFISPDTSPLSHSVPSSTSFSLLAAPVQEASSQNVPERSATLHYVAAGVHKCTIPDCKSESGFKRLEHLKRHQKMHNDKKGLKCTYCQKKLFQVDRSDNYRQHVFLHATPDRKGKRTKFNVKALAELAAWEQVKAQGRSSSAAKVGQTVAGMPKSHEDRLGKRDNFPE